MALALQCLALWDRVAAEDRWNKSWGLKATAAAQRLTLSLARIVDAGFIALHIEGEDKRIAFDGAVAPGPLKPIRAVLEAAARPVEIFWAP